MSAAPETIEQWAEAIFVAAGMRSPDAAALVANLAFAERRGIRTHGFVRMGIYLERMRAGGIVPDACPTVVRLLGATAVVDCADGPGAVGATVATSLAAELASECGIGFVAGRNANHFGAAGFYAEVLADRGLLGLVLCNTDIVMAPPQGGKRVLGTNPLAVAVPTRSNEGVRPLLDMATSHVAYGKLIVADQAGEPIPLGWAVDAEGRPTTDARAGLDGALLPAAGPKGFGLAFMLDALAVLGGAAVSPEVKPLYGDPAEPQCLGFAVIAVDPEAMGGLDAFDKRLRSLCSYVHAGGIAGQAEPMIPGEPEQQAERSQDGELRLNRETATELDALGKQLGIPAPNFGAR